MKKAVYILLAILLSSTIQAISLEQCLESLRQSTPLRDNATRVELQKELKNKNLLAGYYPSLSVVADLGYNSEVTQMELGSGLPISPPVPDKDKESFGLELRQLVWDSGITGLMKEMNILESKARALEINASIARRVMEAVELYYQVLSLREAMEITKLQRSSLLSRLTMLESAYANGLRENTDAQLVKLDLLCLEDKANSLLKTKQAAVEKLSRLCGLELSSEEEYAEPVLPKPVTEEFDRFELHRLDALAELQCTNARLARRKNFPQVLIRAMAGWGKPGYDMFSTQFHDYYSLGISLSWKIWDFGQRTQESRIAQSESVSLEATKANLLLSLQNELSGLAQDLESAEQSIAINTLKVQLLESVIQAYEDKYTAGVITTTELLIQSNNLLSARLDLQSSKTRLSYLQARKLLVLKGEL